MESCSPDRIDSYQRRFEAAIRPRRAGSIAIENAALHFETSGK